jgi:hypothetical protein
MQYYYIFHYNWRLTQDTLHVISHASSSNSITQHTEHQHAKRETGTAGASVKTSREESGKKRQQ